jgi:hypothetical protein
MMTEKEIAEAQLRNLLLQRHPWIGIDYSKGKMEIGSAAASISWDGKSLTIHGAIK